MIYFCATSVFHLLVILYLLETEYKENDSEKTLILLDHVPNLMKCYSRIQSSRLFDHIICIHTDKEPLENIAAELDAIMIQQTDRLHILGKEFVSFYLMCRAGRKAKCIVTDEGVMSNFQIKKGVELYYHKEWFHGETFDFGTIDEIWLLDAKVAVQAEDFIIKDLRMAENLKKPDFRKKYISTLEMIFPKEDCTQPIPQVIFFDAYYLQIYHCISEEMEQHLLRQMVNALRGYDFAVKPHPGEKNYEKYEFIKEKVYKNSYIPWEVLRLYESDQPHKKRIVVSYSASGALFHEKALFDDNTQIIFLNKIYDHFGKNGVGTDSIIEHFMDVYGKNNIFFPESFAEMRRIIDTATGDTPPKPVQSILEHEKTENYEFLLKFYKNNWEMKPSYKNYTSILVLEDGSYHMYAEQKVRTEDGKFQFNFPVKISEKKHVWWYIVRNRKISIKIKRIVCKNSKEATEIDRNTLIYNLSEEGEKGYKDMVISEPSVEFDLPMDQVDEIEISGEWKFDLTYDGMMMLLQKNTKRYDEHIRLLHEDIDDRDTQLRALLKDIDERDAQLKALHKDLIERDQHLTSIYGDIRERDNHLKTVYKRLEKSEIHVELLNKDIDEQEEKIRLLQEELKAWKEGKRPQKSNESKRGWGKLFH